MNQRWPKRREFWQDKSVCATGGAGFPGSFGVEKLKVGGGNEVFIPRSSARALVHADAICQLREDSRPTSLFILLCVCAGLALIALMFLVKNV